MFRISVFLNTSDGLPRNMYTLCLKNVAPLTWYNLDMHDRITIILAEVLL